jgi:GT2 family glycosyltransferase
MMWAARFTDLNMGLHETNAGIADARNQICEDFLKTEEDYVWMVDSDTVPPVRLPKGDQDILCGLYQHLIYNYDQPRLVWSAWSEKEDGYVPMTEFKDGKQIVDAAGTGCMRLSRKALEKIPAPWFENHYERNSRHLSLGEDYDFCQKAKKAGVKVWVDPKYLCHHMKQASLSIVANAALAPYAEAQHVDQD